MIKPCGTEGATVGRNVVAEIANGIDLLHRVGRHLPDPLEEFRTAFTERYGEREVPLVEALDEELGVGFGPNAAYAADAAPLLGGLVFGNTTERGDRIWTRREVLLLQKLCNAYLHDRQEILLDDSDLTLLESEHPLPLPDAFAVTAQIVATCSDAIARGDFQIVIGGISGPSGARYLGRFCDADECLKEAVTRHLRCEETLVPGAIFAEVVHLPEGRLGNILARPLLRDYEIVFVGSSGRPRERQIPVSDLLVTVRHGQIGLRSKSLGRQIIPRLTSAHNYSKSTNLGMYRFLCSLQHQGVCGSLVWDWGVLRSAPFLPRVSRGRVVLSRASWLMGSEVIRGLATTQGTARFEFVQSWRASKSLPRFVRLADGDNLLLLDLENILSIDALAHLVKGRQQFVLTEALPAPGQVCVTGPEGSFLHELVLPFVRRSPVMHQRPSETLGSARTGARLFPPGSQWTYVKLYTGAALADELLRRVVRPFVTLTTETRMVDRWFFVRYGDPSWHIRLRFRVTQSGFSPRVFAELQEIVRPFLSDGLLWRIQCDTYEREVERYGGEFGIELAEQLFHVDSDAVVRVLDSLGGDEGLRLRWQVAALGAACLLDDFGFDEVGKLGLFSEALSQFGAAVQPTKALRIQIGKAFAAKRRDLESVLQAVTTQPTVRPSGFEAFWWRSQRLSEVGLASMLRGACRDGRVCRRMEELCLSYVHMHLNRLLRSAHREQELVLYDFLTRHYRSRAARLRHITTNMVRQT